MNAKEVTIQRNKLKVKLLKQQKELQDSVSEIEKEEEEYRARKRALELINNSLEEIENIKMHYPGELCKGELSFNAGDDGWGSARSRDVMCYFVFTGEYRYVNQKKDDGEIVCSETGYIQRARNTWDKEECYWLLESISEEAYNALMKRV